jgi:hypothetical protein
MAQPERSGLDRVVVCYTPLHLMAAQAIVDQDRASADAPWHLVLPRPEVSGLPPDHARPRYNLISASPVSGLPDGSLRSHWVQAVREADLLARLKVAVRRPYILYYSHLQEFLPNALLAGQALGPPLEGWIIPDGLLNLYDCHVDVRRWLRITAKCGIGALAGLPVRPFTGSLTGLERPTILGEFSFAPAFSMMPSKARVLSLPAIASVAGQFAHLRDATVVLGQEAYARMMGVSRFRSVMAALWEAVRPLVGSRPIIYKPHHSAPYDPLPDFHSAYPSGIVFDDRSPIELTLPALRPHTLVSITSSALVHARLLLSEQPRVVSIGGASVSSLIGRSKEWLDIQHIYKRVGIEVLPLP